MASRIALATAFCETATLPARVLRLISKVIAPGSGVNSASQMEVWPGSLATHTPPASERRVSSKYSGSAAAGYHHGVEARAELFGLRHQFQADGALPGNDRRIVVRRHQRHAFVDVGLGNDRAILAIAIV